MLPVPSSRKMRSVLDPEFELFFVAEDELSLCIRKIIQAVKVSILDHEVGSTLPRILTTILSPLRQRADLKKTNSSSTMVLIERVSRYFWYSRQQSPGFG
jgi:hypothetical protein